MAQNNSKLSLIRTLLKEVKAGIANHVKAVQDERLAKYVLEELSQKEDFYSQDYFAVPTVENTSGLRDYVHHKLTKQHESLEKAHYGGGKASMLQVLKWLDDKKYRVQCAGLAQILFGIYRALGYSAVLSDWVDMSPSYYTDSHMLVEVYIPELEKYIIQDPSYNMMVLHNNTPINTLELMSLLRNGQVLENKEISFVNDMEKEEGVFIPVKELNYEQYLRYFGQVVSWNSGSNVMYPAVERHRHRTNSDES